MDHTVLDNVDEFLQLQTELQSHFRNGFIRLAEAKYILGPGNVSKDCFDLRMTASAFWTDNAAILDGRDGFSRDMPGIRQRLPTIKDKREEEVTGKIPMCDPLLMFTALPPTSLREAQRSFRCALETVMLDEYSHLLNTIRLLDECRRNGDAALLKVNKFHQKIVKTDKFSTRVGAKLLEFYNQVSVFTNLEQRLITDVANAVKAFEVAEELARKKKRKSEDKGASVTAKRSKPDDDISTVLPPGSKVVIKPAEDFILGNILRYNPESKKYECLPIPNAVEKEYPENHTVLALYPNTTCFYKAFVVVPPSKNTSGPTAGHYLVRFDDDGDQNQPVNIMYCLEYPKIRK
ncbi:hypothetical protein HDU83_005722 [Entophlyctis luteolus]|nr:hypothetical protein HDU83_005722 [Entophlyctis luteolus]